MRGQSTLSEAPPEYFGAKRHLSLKIQNILCDNIINYDCKKFYSIGTLFHREFKAIINWKCLDNFVQKRIKFSYFPWFVQQILFICCIMLHYYGLIQTIFSMLHLNNNIIEWCFWFEVKFTTDDSNAIHTIITTR